MKLIWNYKNLAKNTWLFIANIRQHLTTLYTLYQQIKTAMQYIEVKSCTIQSVGGGSWFLRLFEWGETMVGMETRLDGIQEWRMRQNSIQHCPTTTSWIRTATNSGSRPAWNLKVSHIKNSLTSNPRFLSFCVCVFQCCEKGALSWSKNRHVYAR